MVKYKYQSGFGLVETLIAIGILGIAMAGMMSLLSNFHRANIQLTDKMNTLSFRQELERAFRTPSFCDCSFASIPPLGTAPALNKMVDIPEFAYYDTNCNQATRAVVAAKDTLINGSQRVTIQSMTLTNFRPVGASTTNYEVDLQIVYGSELVLAPTVRRIGVIFDDTNYKLKSCRGEAGGGLPCTWDGTWFYYDGAPSNDFAITCRGGLVTGWCGNVDPAGSSSPVGLIPGCYFCEGDSLKKWDGNCK